MFSLLQFRIRSCLGEVDLAISQVRVLKRIVIVSFPEVLRHEPCRRVRVAGGRIIAFRLLAESYSRYVLQFSIERCVCRLARLWHVNEYKML
jgi:hypothetical protein